MKSYDRTKREIVENKWDRVEMELAIIPTSILPTRGLLVISCTTTKKLVQLIKDGP